MKLDQALQEREEARLAVFASREALSRAQEKRKDAERHLAAVDREIDEALQTHVRARRRFVGAVTKLHPLLDADVAGIVGKIANAESEDQQQAEEQQTAEAAS